MLKKSKIKLLVIHCSDTNDDENITAADIHKMHLSFGWDGIGYHKIIKRDGGYVPIPKSDFESFGDLSEDKIDDFVDFVSGDLELDDNFTVDITNDSDDVETLASYDINNNEVTVLGKNRSLPDIIRSVAHELVHHKQNERGELTGRKEEGEDGSPWEDEANAKSGEIVRRFGRNNPEIYDL